MKTLLALSAGFFIASSAQAQVEVPHVVLDRQLRPTAVRIVSISRDSVNARTADGAIRRFPASDVLALFLTPRPPEAPPGRGGAGPHRIELADGHRFVGKVVLNVNPPPGEVSFDSLALGGFTVPLDRVRTIMLDRAVILPIETDTDHLVLANGDTVTGFIESFGRSIVITPPGADARQTTLDAAAVRGASLGNPPAPATGGMVWTDDECLACESINLSPGGECVLRLTTPGGEQREHATELTSVRAVVTDTSLIAPLAELEMPERERAGHAGWNPPRVTSIQSRAWMTRDVEIIGEFTAEWRLPAGALRVAGLAELPESCRDWGNFTLTLYAADDAGVMKQQVSARLNRDNPSAEFNLTLPPGSTRFGARLDPGDDGPIQDRVRLSRALILLDPGKAERKP